MYLNLGAGTDLRKGEKWVNFDIRPLEGIGVVGDIRHLPFKDGEFKKILALDCVEHVTRFELPQVLSEIWRVLAEGGKAIIKMPNLDTIIKRYINRGIDITEFVRLVYGGAEYSENVHKTGANPILITALLHEIGIKNIKITPELPPSDYNNMMTVITK